MQWQRRKHETNNIPTSSHIFNLSWLYVTSSLAKNVEVQPHKLNHSDLILCFLEHHNPKPKIFDAAEHNSRETSEKN